MSKSKMIRPQAPAPRPVLALYRRVSTDRQADEGYSLAVQEEKLLAYAKAFGGEARVYTDDGYSGASLDRPGMEQLIGDIRAGRVTHVVVVKLDRLSRSQKDTLHLIEDIMLPAGVAFISIQESFNTDTAFGRAMVGILSVFAQLERENIFERTRGGMQKRVEQGYWPGGGRTPFGYDYDPGRGILVPNREAEAVRHIYDRYLAGASMQAIADELGLKYERVVYNILTRKANAGFIVYNGREYRGLHQPIVSLETYRQAMDLLAGRSAARLVTKTAHLLTGFCYCGECGARMRYLKWGKAGYKLVCYSQQRSKAYLVRNPNCRLPAPFAEDVEDGVVRALFSLAGRSLAQAKKSVEGGSVEEALRRRLSRAEGKLRRLYGLYGEEGDPCLLAAIEEAREELAQAQAALADEEARERLAASAAGAREKLEGLRDAWPRMSVPERRTVLASVVDRVTVFAGYTDVRLKFGLPEGENQRFNLGTPCR